MLVCGYETGCLFFTVMCSTNLCDACGMHIIWSGFASSHFFLMEDAGGVLKRFGWWYLLGVLLSSLSAVFPRSWQSGTGNDWWRENQILLNFTTVCTGVLELCLTSFLALDQTSREQWKASIYPPLPPLSPMCSLVRPLYTKHMYMVCCLATQNLNVGEQQGLEPVGVRRG